MMKNILLLLLFFWVTACKHGLNVESNLKLWYNQPADASVPDSPNGWKDDPEWLKSLPLGNGSLGVMVFGDINHERIQLNEESMWSGSPHDSDNPEAALHQDKIRQLLFEGKYREATELTNATQICIGPGSGRGNGANVPFGCFQTLGDLWIDWNRTGDYNDYYRELDLKDAVVRIRYTQNGVKYEREIFTSYPDQVMVARFTANKPGQISFSCSLTRPERFRTFSENRQLVMTGALNNGKAGDGLEYMTRLRAINKNGTVEYSDSAITVKNADEVVLLLSASTDYELEYPDYKGRDYKTVTQINIEEASEKTYDVLLNTHKADYQAYFNRVELNLCNLPDTIPTDERVSRFRETKNDNHLIQLVFQYGRYLLISSSRPGTLPANLQGIWANKIQTPWNGDYHTDVNIQMNYWPSGVTNLSEFKLPMFDLIESLVEPGERTAAIQYNFNGWVVHPITNVWGFTSPGEVAAWGMHIGAGAWLCTHVWEHYLYTGDKEFLERMYPVMRGSAEFYLDWLVEHPVTGKLVSGPAVSPENTFIDPDGGRSQITMGPAHDQQVIYQFFKEFLYVAEEIQIEDDVVALVADAKNRLARGIQIGSDGRLMEWPEEFPEAEPGHRHISHLFALHPGSQITMADTPELAAAAKKSLDFRIEHGGGHTGWSAAWLIHQYARLYEAEKAEEYVNTILTRSITPNLFGLHPPFQIDGNFGITSGIAEMLIQSHTGAIHLLPALPKAWPDGEIQGLRARGGYDIDIKWENNELVEARIVSDRQRTARLRYNGKEITVDLRRGRMQTVRLSDFQ
ncbi:MAG: glycoside hydrolase N-terminal domain-containing protein [Mariniphaga sp.]|nr:glycoside hydrolase N-terminal domain-containing protein [Mariniphaga sp.]